MEVPAPDSNPHIGTTPLLAGTHLERADASLVWRHVLRLQLLECSQIELEHLYVGLADYEERGCSNRSKCGSS
jgi:hypothetical protein